SPTLFPRADNPKIGAADPDLGRNACALARSDYARRYSRAGIASRITSSFGAGRLATNALQHLLRPYRAGRIILVFEIAINIGATIQGLAHASAQLRQLILAVIGAAEAVVAERCGLNIRRREFV